MFLLLQVVSVFLVSVAMALALAHALELPGKMRLDKETYLAMQPIYYPGFTMGGGVGEGGGMITTLVLLLCTPVSEPGVSVDRLRVRCAGIDACGLLDLYPPREQILAQEPQPGRVQRRVLSL
jgi:hypothetical protein